ncbi:MAG: hypothetical protein ABI775_01740 [Pseudonocardiales bacterium]
MYRGAGGIGAGAGGLAATGAPIALTLILALIVTIAGLLTLRWGKVRRGQ